MIIIEPILTTQEWKFEC